MSDGPEPLIRALEQRNEHAMQLATLASAAVQIEPELLRALRLLIPDADAGAEADVWLSDLVESRSALAITLRADVRQKLQEQLADRREALAAVADVLARMHAGVSDVIRIEEQVTIESLRNDPGAKDRIDALLAPIVATLEQERHRGLARWAIRAFDAAPPLAKETPSMWRLMRSSSVTRASGTSGATIPVEAVLSELPRRLVRLRLRKDRLEVEGARRQRVVVGGTYFDVARVRAQVVAMLEERGLDVVVVENEPATVTRSLDAALATIEDADAYVTILGNVGGIVPADARNPRRLPLAELEYRHAMSRGIPVLPILVNPQIDVEEMRGLREIVRRSSVAVTVPADAESPHLDLAVLRLTSELGRSLFRGSAGTNIEVPDTIPLMLEVAWDDGGRRSQRITMQPGETVSVRLRPRNVTVAACNGDTFAIEPELELEDYGIIVGGADEAFRDWLVASHGGRLPEENVLDSRPASLPAARRFYAYVAGEFDTSDLVEFRQALAARAEELVLITESSTRKAPYFAQSDPPQFPTRELILVNDVREGPILPPLLEALSGAVSTSNGLILAPDVLNYVREAHPALFWASASDDFVLRKNAFTTVRFEMPRAMSGAMLHLRPAQGEEITGRVSTGEVVELVVRPGRYALAIPEHDYFRTITFRPGHNDIALSWRFNGKWVIVAGGAKQLTPEQHAICAAVARTLADHGFGLFVGAYRGVDELAARTFVERVSFLGGGAVEVFRQYATPQMKRQFEAARAVTVEDDFDAPLSEASALIVIGGSIGTQEYARRAQIRQIPVFPIAATGGVAAKLAEVAAGEFSIDSVSANDIALNIIERIERLTSSTPLP